MWLTVVILLVIVGIFGYKIYQRLYLPNIQLREEGYLYIETGSDFEDVVAALKENNQLVDEQSFRWTATQMKYASQVKPGRYKVRDRMNNRELVNLLRSGKQTPVKLVFTTIRTKDQLAQRIGEQLEARPESILKLLDDEDYLDAIGFNTENVLALFIPNTYEMYWNTSADQFIRRMKREYDKFWTDSRKKKAAEAGLTPVQVSILAAIVQQESNKEEEKPVIAGVYLNRYRKDWKLEADPTLVYALGDFTINRVLSVYKQLDSPYNTYMHKGLPPGPICLPSQRSIDAVLNYQKHNYMYFCAREDFSGYHSFAVSYNQHLENARRFQRALDKRGIKS